MSDYKPVIKDGVTVDYSDGYHTFSELYAHRVELWIQLTKRLKDDDLYSVWRSRLHSDGSAFEGWFVLGVTCLTHSHYNQQLTYHLPDSVWERCGFAVTLERAPPFDGHTSANVLDRLKRL